MLRFSSCPWRCLNMMVIYTLTNSKKQAYWSPPAMMCRYWWRSFTLILHNDFDLRRKLNVTWSFRNPPAALRGERARRICCVGNSLISHQDNQIRFRLASAPRMLAHGFLILYLCIPYSGGDFADLFFTWTLKEGGVMFLDKCHLVLYILLSWRVDGRV